jgi:hypothetical protein
MKRVVYMIGLAVMLAALLAPVAAGAYGLPDPWYQNLQAQHAYQAQQNTGGSGVVPDDRIGIRGPASGGSAVVPDDRIGVRGPAAEPTPTTVSDTDVNWGKTGIVLGSSAFVLLLGTGLFVAMRRPRRTVHA